MIGSIPTDVSHGIEINPNDCGSGSTTLFTGNNTQARSVNTTGWTDGIKNLAVEGEDATCGTTLTPASDTFVFESLQSVETDCLDGIDNDGDGQTDCADSDCEGTTRLTTCGLGECAGRQYGNRDVYSRDMGQ